MTLKPIWLMLPAVLTLIYVGTLVQYPLDFWHHATTGRAIWESSTIPDRDAFTFTIAGQPTTNQCWAAQLGMYLLFRAGGFALAQFVAALCYAAAIGLTTATAWQRSASVRVAAGLSLGAVALALSNFGVRPQAISFALFALELMILWRWPDRWTTPVAIAAIEVLWCNTHGAFPLGVVLPGIFLAGTAWTVARKEGLRAALGNRAVRGYALCVAVASAFAFCNPHPGRTIDYVLGVTNSAPQREIGEWEPCRLDNYTGVAFAASIVGTLLVLAWRWRRVTATDLLLLAPFAILALQHQRMVAWWGMVLVPVLAPHVAAVVSTRRVFGPAPVPASRVHEETTSRWNTAIFFFFLAWAAMSTPWTRSYNLLLPPSKRQACANDEPHRLVEYLGRIDCHGNVFCPMEWGAYLTYQCGPQTRVFIDGRIDFFPAAVWSDYLLIAHAGKGWQNTLARYQIDRIVWSRQMPAELAEQLVNDAGWRKEYEDDLAVAFVRRIEKSR